MSEARDNWRDAPIKLSEIGPIGWLRVVWRGGTLGLTCLLGLGILLTLRLIERPLFGLSRPWTPFVTQMVCRAAFGILRLPIRLTGTVMAGKGAVVANHASWLDIFALNAFQRVYFVSKDEVAAWPFIGWLARATGTVFIARKGTEAKNQQAQFEDRLRAGHQLLFFPEGTSTDALRVLPFKSTLFQALYTHGLDRVLHVQPVTVVYHAPLGQDARFYGWWGEMAFGPHLLTTLAASRQGAVEVIYHAQVPVDAFPSRKELAAYCEKVVRGAHPMASLE
jgi:1-acyl-sn-glycerol-3-phosphate acyltransferase